MNARIERSITLRGVRVNNLRGVDLVLPLGRLIVFTGVSGSGKSSMAFDTLFAEGQRRYVETFSADARRFLDQFAPPDADHIDGLPPAIAVSQHQGFRHAVSSTVGSVTEAQEYLALLYARIGQAHCVACGFPVEPADGATVLAAIEALPEGARYEIAFPVEIVAGTNIGLLFDRFRAEGFVRARVHGATRRLDEAPPDVAGAGSMDVIVDRQVRGRDEPGRRGDSIETAFARGLGRCRLLTDQEARAFVRGWSCARCGTITRPPEPALFRPNSPIGACGACAGIGFINGAVCPDCRGARLRPEALAVTVMGLSIAELSNLSVRDALMRLNDPGAGEGPVGRALLGPVLARLQALDALGLGYLTLDRRAATLSDGESRRVTLAAALRSGLVNALYVFDEPTVGLHPRDNTRLVQALQRLRDRGNTVVVVEHDPALIQAADEVVDFGPGAGPHGGTILYQGPPHGLRDCPGSVTGTYLRGQRGKAVPAQRRPCNKGELALRGASGHNLKGVDVDFPLGVLCAVVGVSGSGKSSLIKRTLAPALCGELGALPYRSLEGASGLAAVRVIDATPIGRTPRSNPATYLKAHDAIRRAFAATHEAKVRDYSPSTFSFNVEGGRCSACEGNGRIRIGMQFLPDVWYTCPECRGARFRPEVLEATYRGKSIAEVLELTVREALAFFRNRPKVQARLRPLLEVGLDYLRLGQPTSTLSGGEAQRLKLAAFLGGAGGGIGRTAGAGPRSLFILDEPTAGLHPADVHKLLEALDRLVDLGHSLIVVEHHPEVLLQADWLIELGPGAGDEGGRIIAVGRPEGLAQRDTPTGRALAGYLESDPQPPAPKRPVEGAGPNA